VSDEAVRLPLEGRYPDPDGGQPLGVATRAVVIAPGIAGEAPDLVRPLALGHRLAIVSDRTTHGILGARVARALEALGPVQTVVLPVAPHADEDTASLVARETSSADALIAVGSRTLNDLVKYVVANGGKACAVFGTAPSMNGYTSPSAAITAGGLKRSLPAVAPVGVFLDVDVLAHAPARLIRAGLGDSLCRPTAQADWLLAHLVRGEPYRTAPFALLALDEPALLAEPEALAAGDPEAVARLARTLVLSGFGMAICGGSYPASQGEHRPRRGRRGDAAAGGRVDRDPGPSAGRHASGRRAPGRAAARRRPDDARSARLAPRVLPGRRSPRPRDPEPVDVSRPGCRRGAARRLRRRAVADPALPLARLP
jgi:glycerol-1-phosphate dehydrogenase [NAD(P)+]